MSKKDVVEIHVNVKLHELVCRQLRAEGRDPGDTSLEVVLEEGNVLRDLMNGLGLSPKHFFVAIVNGVHCTDLDLRLSEGDRVAFLPPIAGG
jgi:molybdopterin converting factor small subunit